MEVCPECKQPVNIVSQDEQMVYEPHLDRDGQHCPLSGERPTVASYLAD